MNKKILIVIILVIAIIIIGIITIHQILKNNDNNTELSENNYFIYNNSIYEKVDSINEKGLTNNIIKINNICKENLKSMNVYFAMIPNKEYYLNKENEGNQEFSKIEEYIKSKINKEIKYIELYDTLNLDCYYRTDMHWKQENLGNVIEKISKEMNLSNKQVEYETKSLGDFYGTYYNELKDDTVKPDELIYLTNNMIENCDVYNEEQELIEKVYNLERANKTNNKYDVFLSGATAIQNIKNNEINNGKKLILFRDSFGSSIAPLLIKNYEEILLIDIRYVNSAFLSNFIDFRNYENQDVLFLYNTRVINKSGIFR